MSLRKLTLGSMPSNSIKRPRVFSTQAPTIRISSISSQKRIVHNIPSQRQPSSLQPPRLRALCPFPPSTSKHIRQRSVKCRQKAEQVRLDHIMVSSQQKKIVSKVSKNQGMSRQALSQRKQSHLNTYFNIRKNKLQEITKENKKIYVRINSQKSLYSSRKLDKSTSSLSNSRKSNNSNTSFCSKKSLSKMSKPSHQRKKMGNNSKKKIQIVEKNIDHLQLNEVSNYLRIFCNHSQRNAEKSPRASYEKVVDGKGQNGKENHHGPSALQKIVEEYGSKYRNKVLLPKLFN